jgi:hypothetical protein
MQEYHIRFYMKCLDVIIKNIQTFWRGDLRSKRHDEACKQSFKQKGKRWESAAEVGAFRTMAGPAGVFLLDQLFVLPDSWSGRLHRSRPRLHRPPGTAPLLFVPRPRDRTCLDGSAPDPRPRGVLPPVLLSRVATRGPVAVRLPDLSPYVCGPKGLVLVLRNDFEHGCGGKRLIIFEICIVLYVYNKVL